MKKEVFFDVETKKIFSEISTDNPGDLGVSVVSVYSRVLNDDLSESGGIMQSFWEKDFDKMWPIFQEADRIIGFNSIGFDVPALKPYTDFAFDKLSHFDIMYQFKDAAGKRIGLDAIAKETLGTQKTDSGLNAVYYWKKGDHASLEKLRKYCEADVLLTRDIYDFVLKNKHLLYKDRWNTLRKVELDFSYPADAPTDQIGLF